MNGFKPGELVEFCTKEELRGIVSQNDLCVPWMEKMSVLFGKKIRLGKEVKVLGGIAMEIASETANYYNLHIGFLYDIRLFKKIDNSFESSISNINQILDKILTNS